MASWFTQGGSICVTAPKDGFYLRNVVVFTGCEETKSESRTGVKEAEHHIMDAESPPG